MRILTGLSLIAMLAMATPVFAQATEVPAPAAPAVAPVATPEGVTEEADKLLWCGHALSFASTLAEGQGDADGAKALLENGVKLIDKGAALLTDLAPEQLDAAKAVYVEQVKIELAGTGENAKFSYDDCMTLVQ